MCRLIGFASGFGAPVLADVFTAGEDGYHTYRIPAIVVTSDGTVLAFCEGRKHNQADSGKVALLLKRSRGGKTWSPQQVVWSDGDNTCGNPAPVVDETSGTVWLLMTWNRGEDSEKQIAYGMGKDTRRVFVTSSANNGRDWSVPREITSAVKKPEWHWYATGPVNGIQLLNGPHRGRLLVPANHSELLNRTQSVSFAHVIYSDDHGGTWRLGGVEEKDTNESTLVELADGTLMQNMRSYQGKHRRAVATSRDAGETWSPVRLDQTLIEPVCQGALLRCSWPTASQRSRILFSNPASLKRENLTIRLSYDECGTWPVSKVIHAGPSAYSCLAILPDKSLACLFECGEKTAYEKIRLARFSLEWLENEKE